MRKENSTIDISHVMALRDAPLGRVLETSAGRVIVRESGYSQANGCCWCIYRTEDGARKCLLKHACMGHFRSDRKSVFFAEVK